MEIIFMEPVYKDFIWGGNFLKTKLGKKTQLKKVAESWEISSNENGNCIIKNEQYGGITLKELFSNKNVKEEIFGRKSMKLDDFPLLIKFIDAKENLSIQVHPDDQYAIKKGFKNGKNEMWYILECEKNAKIVGGLNTELSKKNLKYAIENNQIKEYLNYINIRKRG